MRQRIELSNLSLVNFSSNEEYQAYIKAWNNYMKTRMVDTTPLHKLLPTFEIYFPPGTGCAAIAKQCSDRDLVISVFNPREYACEVWDYYYGNRN